MVTTRTVVGSWERWRSDGTREAAAGQVRFEPSNIITDANTGTVVVRDALTATLNDDGAISVEIPVTDDADHTPTGWYWRVEERVDGRLIRSYDLEVPTSGTDLDLSDVDVAVDTPTPTASYVTLTAFNSHDHDAAYSATGHSHTESDVTDLDHYTDTDANAAIDVRVGKAFVDALNVDADTLDGSDSTAFATSAHAASHKDAGADPVNLDADEVDYDNATSGLTATEVQAAIDEVAGDIGTKPQAINPQTGTTYTPVADDLGKLVTLDNASAITVTLPQDSAVTIPVGGRIDFAAIGAGIPTFVAGTGATVNGTPSLVMRDQWSAVSAVKRAADTWLLVGDLAT